jgi:hypothetical protein
MRPVAPLSISLISLDAKFDKNASAKLAGIAHATLGDMDHLARHQFGCRVCPVGQAEPRAGFQERLVDRWDLVRAKGLILQEWRNRHQGSLPGTILIVRSSAPPEFAADEPGILQLPFLMTSVSFGTQLKECSRRHAPRSAAEAERVRSASAIDLLCDRTGVTVGSCEASDRLWRSNRRLPGASGWVRFVRNDTNGSHPRIGRRVSCRLLLRGCHAPDGIADVVGDQ